MNAFIKANPVYICFILVLGIECNQKSKQANETFANLGKNLFIMPSFKRKMNILTVFKLHHITTFHFLMAALRHFKSEF